MRLRALTASIVGLCASATAQSQTDTSRPRPVPHPTPRAPLADTGLAHDIETVVVVKPGGLGDRLGLVVRRRMLATLEAKRRYWEERRPRAYAIRVLKLSDCIAISTRLPAEGGPWRDRLVIRDTSIVGREPAPIAAAYAQRCGLAWRVDDLFADVARALADTTEYITGIEYDAAYGFPRAYWRDSGDPYSTTIQRPYAGSWGVLVESFAPAP